MVNEKGKAIVSSSNPVKMNGQETGVACESKEEEENASKEVTNEENGVLETKNGKVASGEEKNGETAIVEEENSDGDEMEADGKNESVEIEGEEDNDDEEEKEEEAEEEGEEQEEEVIGEQKEENIIEQEEEKVGAQSKEKANGPRKRSRKKKMETEEEEGDEEDEEEKGEENEEDTNEQEKDKGGANSGEKVKRPRKRSRKNKMAGIGSETLATKKADDKPGTSGNKKESKRAESMGMIFMCSSKTKKDCYRFNVLGLPASKKDIVQKIYKGMRLFLFDFDLRLMYGIYKAAGPGGYNIEPKAFKSAFPSQVRFTVLDDCLPLAEEKFKTVIKENYYGKNKFNCQLNSKQVKDLCKLFAVSSRGSKSNKLSKNARAEPRIARAEPRVARAEPRVARAEPRVARAEPRSRVDRGRIRGRGRDRERRSSALVADHRHYDTRPPKYDRETYRRRNRDEERRSPEPHRHHDRPIMYERELAPLHRLPPLPPPTTGAPPYAATYASAPSYASYGRTLEVDAYGRDLVVERRDPRLLDLDVRHRDEFGSRDSYISYREIPSYRDTLYSSVAPPPEYYAPVEPRAEYRLAGPPPLEYRRPAAAPSEYDRLGTLYRY